LKDYSVNQERQKHIKDFFSFCFVLFCLVRLFVCVYQTENRRRGVNGGGERNRAAGFVIGGVDEAEAGAALAPPPGDPVTTTGR
jgi:hypothetical protein